MRVAVVALAAVALAACAIPPEKTSAQGDPYACINDVPKDAPDPVILTGVVTDPNIPKMIAQANVQLFLVSDLQKPTKSATSEGDGSFRLSEATSTQPFDGFVYTAQSGYKPSSFYPAVPFFENTSGIGLEIYTDDELTGLAMFQMTDPPIDLTSTVTVVVTVVDCNGKAIPGATVTTSPPAKVTRYLDSDGAPNPSATSTDSGQGLAFLFGLPNTSISIMANAALPEGIGPHTFRTHAVQGDVGSVAAADIRP